MEIEVKHLKTLGGLLLNAGANVLIASCTGGLLAGSSILGELIKSVTGNLASNHISAISNLAFDQLASRLKENDPNKVNHDLERLFRESSVVALEFIKKLFLQDIDKIEEYNSLNSQDKKTFITNLIFFFDESIADLRMIVKDEIREPLDKNLIRNPKYYLDNITQQIFRMTSITFHPQMEQSLKDFYAKNLTYCFDLAFKEALKHDEVGFKAFQIWTLEELQKQNAGLLTEQKRISEAIESLKNGGNFLNKEEEEKKWDRIADGIYANMEVSFTGITKQLTDLTRQISARFDELAGITKATHTIVVDVQKDVKDLSDGQKKLHSLAEEINSRIKSGEYLQEPPPLKRDLGSIPFEPQFFIGRETELDIIRKKFLEGIKIIPLSGEGGLGKSSLVSTYYHKYCQEYAHVAWVLNEGSMTNSLLSLATSLNLSFGEAMPLNKRLNELVKTMTSLPKPCLLIIDNSDKREDADSNNQLLRRLHNFHILITTRLKTFGDIDIYEIKGLPCETGLKLFKKYYKKHLPSEDELFYQLYDSIGGNTLVVELLAKNLNTLNRFKVSYTLKNLLTELQRGMLSFSKMAKVSNVDYHAHGGMMRTETPQAIIEAMYEISDLSRKQVSVLSSIALLPAESISYDALKLILADTEDLDSTLDSLYQNGWLDFNEASISFKISPIIQGIVQEKNTTLLQDCTPAVIRLSRRLEENLQKDDLVYLRYAASAFEILTVRYRNLKGIENTERELLGILGFRIAQQYDDSNNSLLVDYFITLAIEFFETILTEEYTCELRTKNKQNILSGEERNLVMFYEAVLELAAQTKSYLGFLRDTETLFNKARTIADPDPDKGFNLSFNIYAYNRYLVKAGRMMEAEPYFFRTYKSNKNLYNTLTKIETEDDLARFFQIKEIAEPDFEKMRTLVEQKKKEAYSAYMAASLDLAILFRTQGRFEEAIYFHQKFIELAEKKKELYSETDAAIGLHSMAIALLMEGKNLGLSGRLLNSAYRVYEKNYRKDHYYIGHYLMVFFQIYLKRENPIEECFRLYYNAVQIIAKNRGEDSADIIEMNISLHEALQTMQNYDEKIFSLKRQTNKILVRIFLENFDHTVDRLGIYHPVLHKGLELTAQILDNEGHASYANVLRGKRQEFIRILNKRTDIRTYDLPVKIIADLEEKKELVNKIKSTTSLPADIDAFELSLIRLPFYKTYDLCRILFLNTAIQTYKYVLIGSNNVIPLETTNTAIYDLGEKDLQLTDESVIYYLTFFFDSVSGRYGKFFVMNDYADIPWQIDISVKDAVKEAFKKIVLPIRIVSSNENKYVLHGHYIFKNNLCEANFIIIKSSGITALDEEDVILIDTAQAEYVPVRLTDKNAYRLDHPSCKLILDIPACIDPIY